MTSYTVGALLEVDSTAPKPQNLPNAPPKALPRTYHSVPTEIEPAVSIDINTPPNANQTRKGVNVDIIRPATPVDDQYEMVEAMQSFDNPPMNRFRMLAICLMNFSNGLNDSAPGALIPYMEKQYNIGYAVVSLIFITNAVGFVSAAVIVDAVRGHFGRAKTLMIAQSIMALGYVMLVSTPPYPIVVLSFFFLGLGMAMNLALGNVFAANLQNGTQMLGLMHGSYGLGGTVGPLIATAMVSKGGFLFTRYYLLILGLTIVNFSYAGWSFWNYEAESAPTLLTSLEMTASRTQNDQPPGKDSTAEAKERLYDMAKSFKSKVVMLGALFVFAYQGAEVSISGWVISFLIATRNGNPASVGYVTAGFWGGITVGRFLLSHPAHKIGEKIFVYIMVIGAIVFQLLVWLVPNIVGEAVALAIVGLLLGPVYPCAMAIVSRSIPRKEQVSGMSVISGFGSSGGAVAPFTTGILAQAAGTFVMHPIAIGLFVFMMVCWRCLPTPRKRTD